MENFLGGEGCGPHTWVPTGVLELGVLRVSLKDYKAKFF